MFKDSKAGLGRIGTKKVIDTLPSSQGIRKYITIKVRTFSTFYLIKLMLRNRAKSQYSSYKVLHQTSFDKLQLSALRALQNK